MVYKRKPADLGIRSLTVQELARTDLWQNGPEFLKKLKQDWSEYQLDKPTIAENLELKGTKETVTAEATSYQISEEGGETDCGSNASVEEKW